MKKLIPLLVAIIGGSAIAFYAWYTRSAPEPPHLIACDVSYCPQLSDTREWALLFGEMPSVDATEWNQLFGKTFEASPDVGGTWVTFASPTAYRLNACTIGLGAVYTSGP